MGQAGASGTPFPIEFPGPTWAVEVERLDQRSLLQLQAKRARREIEAGRIRLRWSRCEVEGIDGTSLPHCWKLYLPLNAAGASAAPFGFVFRLIEVDGEPTLKFLAFGERHPSNPRTKSVYERAHKRLHGCYP